MTVVRRLPSSREDAWEWQLSAACRGMDTELFFQPDNQRGPQRRDRDQAAKRICQACPVRGPCRKWALLAREPYGVWGGLTAEERSALQSKESA